MLRLLFSFLIVLLLSSCIYCTFEKDNIGDIKEYIDDEYEYELSQECEINIIFNLYGRNYLVKVDITNKIMLMYSGEKIYFGKLNNSRLGNITKREEIELSDSDLEKMERLVLLIETFSPNDICMSGMYEITIGTSERQVSYVYGNARDPELDEIISWIIEKSPFMIIDNYGNEFKPIDIEKIRNSLNQERVFE